MASTSRARLPWILGGLGVLAGAYLWRAGGDPKVAERKLKGGF